MKTWIVAFSVALTLAICGSTSLRAETAAEMLEKGIYNEETIGNLDEAIKIYRKILGVADETEKLAAQAQYRLAGCLLKQRKKEEAVRAFQAVVDNYPEQRELVTKARQYLPEQLRLLPAPWKEGEQTTLTMKLPGGRTVGIIGLRVNAAHQDNRDVWRMDVRRFVAAGQNEGVSRVVIDQSSNRPLSTNWDHTVLGTTSAVWHDDRLAITTKGADGKTETNTVDFDGAAYSNDQWFFGFRQLPLEIGYSVTIPLRIAFTGGNPVDLKVSVEKMENVKTSVGDFNCFRLETNIAQTFWVADVPERYLVRFVGGGVDATLSSVTYGDATPNLENDALGLSLFVPQGWLHFDLEAINEESAGGFHLVAFQMVSAVVSIKDRSLLGEKERESLQAWAEDKIERGKLAVKGFELRSESMKDTRLAGAPAKTFVADYESQGRDFVTQVDLAMKGEKVIAVGITAAKDEYEPHREQFEALLKSVSVR